MRGSKWKEGRLEEEEGEEEEGQGAVKEGRGGKCEGVANTGGHTETEIHRQGAHKETETCTDRQRRTQTATETEAEAETHRHGDTEACLLGHVSKKPTYEKGRLCSSKQCHHAQ
jgi:hypothetical protein